MKHSLKIAERSATRRTVPEGAASTETLDLALRLLEQLASSGAPIGVSELAREFGASKATVYRHLRTLARHGFVHQDWPSGTLPALSCSFSVSASESASAFFRWPARS